jgi:TolB-like protein/Tfp pilus assembly protein PilF/tRNA A-37 threonylcarbamoyl transferase component Bud32
MSGSSHASSLDALKAALADRYRIERAVGQGGMATVWLAEDLRHHRKVAIKLLQPGIAQALAAERFLREIQIAAGLTHPHILPLLDSGEAAGFLYYVMPYIAGESLRQRLAREGTLPVPESARLLREIADALAKAHREGIVHRDIKPENVLLADGHALVADFGVAKGLSAAGSEGTLTTVGTTVGTPAYMAPEQAAGDPEVDQRADLYALGVVGYEMLAGRPPFTGTTPQQILAAQITMQPEPLGKHRSLPAPLADLVMRLLAKSPGDRPQTAEQLLPVLDAATTPSGTAVAHSAPMERARARGPARKVAAGLLAAVAVAAAVYAGARHRSPGAAGAPVAGAARSVAVLPFTNLSRDTANEYFSDGISEEILNAVGQLPGVLVPARSSAFAFKGQSLPVREVARRLQVAHVLEGSVQREGNRVRITAQLVDASTGFQRWSGKYDRDATDIFAVEDEISRAIATALQVQLAGGGAAGASAGETTNPEAHDLYLLGLHYMNQRSTDRELATAADYFARAVARDPAYARAYAGRASALLLLPEYAAAFDTTLLPAGRAAVEKALALDSTLAPAHLALGYLLKSYEWNWRAAEREYRIAIALEPNLATAHQWLAELLIDQRRLPEARSEVDTALTLDPAAPLQRLVEGQYDETAGLLDAAAAAYRRAAELNPAFLPAYIEGGQLAAQMGRYDDARDQFRRAAALLGDTTLAFVRLLDGAQRPADRTAAIRNAEQQLASGRMPIVVVARFFAMLDERDRAIGLLQRAVAQHAPFTTYLCRWVEFRRLEGDPRYRAILKQVGLPLPEAGAPRRGA